MLKRVPLLTASILVLVLLFTVACGQDAGQPDGEPQTGDEQPKQVLRIAMTYDWDNLDPIQLGNRTSHQVANNIYSALVRYELGGTQLEGDLAKTWERSDDGKTLTFQLREGVQFHHDYGELTAEDVIFSLERAADPDQSRYAEDLKAIESVEAINDYEVVIHLEYADPFILYKMAEGMGYIVSKAAVEEHGEDFGHNPIGTGPFAFDSWLPDERTVLVKHEDYFWGASELDEVHFMPIAEASTFYKAYEAKEVDMIMVSDPDRYEKYASDDAITLFETPGLITRFIALNTHFEPFDDLRARLAMQYAINRDEIIDHALKGMSVKADSPLAPGTFGYEPVFDYEYDPETGNIFAENLRDIGVTANIEIMETATYLAKVRTGEAPMYSHSQNPMVMPHQFFVQRYHPASFPPGDNATYYDNERVTNLIDELGKTVDEDTQLELIQEIQQQVADDAHYIDLDHEKFIWAAHSYVKGFTPDAWRSYRVETTTIEPH